MTAPATLDIPLVPPPGGEVLYASPRATVIWGDCRDPVVIASVPDWYGLLCTDPPYGINWQSGTRKTKFAHLAGDDGSVNWPQVLADWVGPTGTYTRGLATSRHVYVFGYTPDQVAEPLRLSGCTQLIWDKDKVGLGNLALPWGPQHEVIVFGVHTKPKSGRTRGEGNLSARLRQGTVIRARRPNATSVTRHPTEKPLALMAQLIESSTIRGDLVVDPCAGSGSTIVAAILEGRRGFGVEIDRGYAELMVQRVKAAEKIADQIGKC